MKRFTFKATLLRDDKRTGYKIGRVMYPKGFYYQKKTIVLVGSINPDNTVRLAFPADSVLMEVTLGYNTLSPKPGVEDLK